MIPSALLAFALLAAPASGQAAERCYGVARAGETVGIGADGPTATASIDYQGNAWKMVPVGTCLTMPLAAQPDGTPRRGSFEPLSRDLPD